MSDRPEKISKKRFDNPHKLGFMRLLQINYLLIVITCIFLLTLSVKGRAVFTFDDYMALLYVICSGTAFWMILRRKRAARWLIIAFSAFNTVVGLAGDTIIAGHFDPGSILDEGRWLDIIAILYFLTSRRARAVLTQDFTLHSADSYVKESENLYQPRTWAFWRNLIIYFCVFSVVGHWLEALYCTFIRFGLLPGIYDPTSQIWSDWLYPFLVYGFGAVACVLVLFPIKNVVSHWARRQLKDRNPLLAAILTLFVSFVANALLCTLIEFTMGMILNQPDASGHYPLWDYSGMAFNFMGQVCLQNAVAFGAVATLMVWIIYPLLERALSHASSDVMWVVFLAVVIMFALLMALYLINIPAPALQ
ncbi:MAG: putative ABC transporter permease [Coriobacteriales bacterium]|jgi:uncharacterized membrane protein|nr:putative ABC transporter permease [Coriobacteriales bacterium]